jgi:transposase InsO family protein
VGPALRGIRAHPACWCDRPHQAPDHAGDVQIGSRAEALDEGDGAGGQYASDRHQKLLKNYGMVQSMGRRASCWDNAVMESFFKTLKVERIYLLRYDTREIARLDIVDWIEGFYNHTRLHSSIGYKTPVDFESNLMAA